MLHKPRTCGSGLLGKFELGLDRKKHATACFPCLHITMLHFLGWLFHAGALLCLLLFGNPRQWAGRPLIQTEEKQQANRCLTSGQFSLWLTCLTPELWHKRPPSTLSLFLNKTEAGKVPNPLRPRPLSLPLSLSLLILEGRPTSGQGRDGIWGKKVGLGRVSLSQFSFSSHSLSCLRLSLSLSHPCLFCLFLFLFLFAFLHFCIVCHFCVSWLHF